MRHYLPRFLLVLVTVPLCFALTAFAAAQSTRPGPAAALVGAVSFAAIVLAPSNRNAAVRAGLLAVLVAAVSLVGILLGTR